MPSFAGEIDTKSCSAALVGTELLGVYSVPAGVSSKILVYARDSYGNPVTSGTATFSVTLQNAAANAFLRPDSVSFVKDHYEVVYTPSKAGVYQVSKMRGSLVSGFLDETPVLSKRRNPGSV